MSRKDKSQGSQNAPGTGHEPIEQAIAGRLAGSDTDLESKFDARHDISNVDCQEGNMNHGTKGGCFDEDRVDGNAPIF
jgi:hypothetical protein